MRHIALSIGLALLASFGLGAAVVQGVVLDEETGYPLARAHVSMLPIAGTGAEAVSLHSGDRGSFTVLSVRAGWYVLRVTRVGFAPAEAGQMRAGRPGTPFEVTSEDRASFFQIRMRRLPAVTGSVLDENNIGIADFAVHIYSARRPVRRITETRTDDRGNFRIGALEPGSYVVRSGAAVLEDDYSLVPTYYKYGTALENAEPVRLRLGETQPDIAIHPVRGKLLSISGVFSVPADDAGRLVLVTDTGRRTIASASGPFNTTVRFDASGIPPGAIELIAEGGRCGDYMRRVVNSDSEGFRINCASLQRPRVDWRVDGNRSPVQYPLFIRRVDLDGAGPIKAMSDRELVAPGHWEVMAQTGATHYVKSVAGGYSAPATVAEDGWFGIDVGTNPLLLLQLSSKPAAVKGTVTTGGKAVTGAVVYLELYDAEKQNLRLQLWSTRSDLQGGYSFVGLRPGQYRVLSTFDFDPEDRFAMERAAEVKLAEGDKASQSVEMVLP